MKSRLVFFCFLVVSNFAAGQSTEITGTIVAFNKFPLTNILVKAKKSKQEVLTDSEGKFSISVNPDDIIYVEGKTFRRYIYRLKKDDQSLRINLIYEDKKSNRNSAVQAGYIRSEDLEIGLNKMASENNIYSNFTDVFEAIKYALPSAIITTENGQKKVTLRGGSRSFTASSAALIAVNGILAVDVSYITPANIISIKELQGPAATMYGTGSGNGVIEITLK